MTISSTTNSVSFNGNGSTTVFAYNFKIFAAADMQVILRSSTGTETVKSLTTHYSLSGIGVTSGGNVTMGTAPASGETLTLRRIKSSVQELDLVSNSAFPAANFENQLDKIVMMIQQNDEDISKAIKLSPSNTMTSTEFTNSATDRANKLLSFDGSGELSVTQELGVNRGNWAASTSYNQRDLVKDTSTSGNNSIYFVNTAHTSSGSLPISSNTDSAKFDLLVDLTSSASISGVTAGTVTASKTVVVDANKDIASFRNLTATGTITAGTFVLGTASLNENDLESIDGITAGTVAASKAVIVDANKDVTGFNNVTLTGELDAATLDISGDANIAGEVQTTKIAFTNGDDAMTITNTGLVEFNTGFNIGSDAAGDILYNNGSKYVRLAKGTDGQALVLASGVPAWATNAGDIAGVTAGVGLSGGGTSGTVTVNVDAAQTGITSVINTSLVVGRDADNQIQFGTDDFIKFRVDGSTRMSLISSALSPTGTIDLGSNSSKFQNIFLSGDVEAATLDLSSNADIAGNLTFSGSTAKINLVDNNATALSVKEGSNNYMVFDTADSGGEQITLHKKLDLNGVELILDADGDTSIHSDTDDQIDIRIAGSDDFTFTANTFTAASFSTIAAQALTATSLDVTGVATAATFEPDGDTSTGDAAAIGYTAAEGLILTGQGSTSDITFKNDADVTVCTVPTGLNILNFPSGTGGLSFGASHSLTFNHNSSTGNSTINCSTGSLLIGTTSGIPISIGHTTSETTVNDNLTVTGNLTASNNKILGTANHSDMGVSLEGLERGYYQPTLARQVGSSVVMAGNPIGFFFGNVSFNANMIKCVLFYSGGETASGITYDSLGFSVGASSSSSHTVNIGIFTRNKYGLPSQRIHNAAFSNPGASTGVKTDTTEFTLKPGWYYACLHCSDINLTIAQTHDSSSGGSYMRDFYGGYGSTFDPSDSCLFKLNFTYSDDISGETAYTVSNIAPLIQMKIKTSYTGNETGN